MKRRRTKRRYMLFYDEAGITVAAFGLFSSISIPVLCYFIPEISSIYCVVDRVLRIIGCAASAFAFIWVTASVLIHHRRDVFGLVILAFGIAVLLACSPSGCCNVGSAPSLPVGVFQDLVPIGCFTSLIAVHLKNLRAIQKSPDAFR